MSSLYSFFKFSSSYRKLRRMRDIASVLAVHGFGDIATRIGLRRVWRGLKRKVTFGRYGEGPDVPTTGERLRTACEELGPTYVKFGQMLATRPDLFPPDIIAELSRLQDQVPPFSFDRVKMVLETQLHGDASEVFQEIDEKPLAAASIAQVHRAVLQNGDVVALKVKRPEVNRTIPEDLEVLKIIANYLEENFEELHYVQPIRLVEEFARILKMEMDFRNEVRNMLRFAENFSDEPVLRVPKPYEQYCTEDLIVMEFMNGMKVTEVPDWDAFPLERKDVADIGARLLLQSVYEHRFYHADPHAGNFMVDPEGKICLLDFGMMGYVAEGRIEEMLSFMVGLVSYDTEMLVDSILQAGLAPADLDVKGLKRDLEIMLQQFAQCSLEELRLEPLIRQAVEVVFKYRITLPTDLLGVARAVSTMEGLGRQIYPGFTPLEEIQPYLISLFLRRALDPTQQSGHLVDLVLDWGSMLKNLPQDIKDIIRRIKMGELTVQYEDRNFKKATVEANRRTNRMAGAVVAFAGVAGAAMLTLFPGMPDFIPISGAAVSFLMSVWVVRGIRRSGGM